MSTTMSDLAPLGYILRAAGISRAWYKKLEANQLVPGFIEARSLGRGKGRRYLYPLREALDDLRVVQEQLKAGVSIEELKKRASHRASRAWEYSFEDSVEDVIKSKLAISDRLQRRAFLQVVKSARAHGAFSNYKLPEPGGRKLFIQFRNPEELDDFAEELKVIYDVFRRGQPGNAVMVALVRNAIGEHDFNMPNLEDEEEQAREFKRWQKHLERLRNEEAFWRNWPESLKFFKY